MESPRKRKFLVPKRNLKNTSQAVSQEKSPKRLKTCETPASSSTLQEPQRKQRSSFNDRLKRIRDASEIIESPQKLNYDKLDARVNLDHRVNVSNPTTKTVILKTDFTVQGRLKNAMNKLDNFQFSHFESVNKPNLFVSGKTNPVEIDKNYKQSSSSFVQHRLNFQNKPSTITSNSLSYEVENRFPLGTNIACDIIQDNSMIRFDEEESMDWSPIDPEELLEDIKKARLVLSQQPPPEESVSWYNESVDNRPSNVNNDGKNIFIVIDTNVFIDKLQTITNILHISYEDGSFPVIYVPWMVIQELDYFKDGYSLSNRNPNSGQIQERCKRAVKYINQILVSHKPKLIGQSVQDASDHSINSSNPDDAILSSCLQLSGQNNVILLSSDVNLRNKAIINNIHAESPDGIVRVLLDKKRVKRQANVKGIILDKMSFICSFIMDVELKQFLGSQIYERKKFPKLPWSFVVCLKYMMDYYASILKNRVQKQCYKVINDLHSALQSNDDNDEALMQLSLSLLVYLKVGLPKYLQNIQKIIAELRTLDI